MSEAAIGRGSDGTQARKDGHGRSAAKPTQIPAAGWKDAMWRVYAEIDDDRVMLVAAGVTYYLLLALVPALTALVSVYGLFADPATMSSHLEELARFLPAGGMDILREQVTRLTQSQESTLGFTFVVSLAIALWSANAGLKALFEAMNVAYDEKESRSFIRLNAVSLLFTLCTVAGALLLLGSTVVVPLALQFLQLGSGLEWAIGAVAGLLTLVALSLGIASLYRWGPSRQRAKWRWITPGAILTLVTTAIVSTLFSFYATNVTDFNATYGSLGALIGFMTWIWLTMIVLIIGAELNSELEHQTARDSTTGAERPLGARGATMADRVAGGTDPDHDIVDRSGRRAAAKSTTAPQRMPVSLGRLAVALPAALALSWALGREQGRRSRS